ncbi:MAG: transposase [bacterium]|nr:transposase [bacterium]
MERFWRSLKELLEVRLLPPISAAQLEVRTELALTYYAAYRPHQGLGGATPLEIYLNETPAAQNAIPPPRKHETTETGNEPLPSEIIYLDPGRRLSVLVQTDRAA